MKDMHVVQFIHRYPPALGGAESYTARLSRSLVAAGHRVSVWTTTANHLGAFRQSGLAEFSPGMETIDGVEVRRFPLSWRFPGRRYVLKAASLLPGLAWKAQVAGWMPISWPMQRAVSEPIDRPDVVHALAFPYSFLAYHAMRLARRSGARFVITPFLHLGDLDRHDDPVRRAYTSPPLRWLLKQADAVLVQTSTEFDAVCSLGVDQSKVVLQGLGVDARECTGGNRERARISWKIDDNELVVGHLANLSEEKGSVDLLRSAHRVTCNAKVVFAGTSMPNFDRAWNDPDRPKNVLRVGPLSADGLRDFFAGIDLFALPSRSDSFGLVLLEAWSNRVPVIAYRAGGVGALVRHETDGLLVRCGDLTGLAEAIDRLGRDDVMRMRYGVSGQSRVEQEFRWIDKLQIAHNTLLR